MNVRDEYYYLSTNIKYVLRQWQTHHYRGSRSGYQWDHFQLNSWIRQQWLEAFNHVSKWIRLAVLGSGQEQLEHPYESLHGAAEKDCMEQGFWAYVARQCQGKYIRSMRSGNWCWSIVIALCACIVWVGDGHYSDYHWGGDRLLKHVYDHCKDYRDKVQELFRISASSWRKAPYDSSTDQYPYFHAWSMSFLPDYQ